MQTRIEDFVDKRRKAKKMNTPITQNEFVNHICKDEEGMYKLHEPKKGSEVKKVIKYLNDVPDLPEAFQTLQDSLIQKIVPDEEEKEEPNISSGDDDSDDENPKGKPKRRGSKKDKKRKATTLASAKKAKKPKK